MKKGLQRFIEEQEDLASQELRMDDNFNFKKLSLHLRNLEQENEELRQEVKLHLEMGTQVYRRAETFLGAVNLWLERKSVKHLLGLTEKEFDKALKEKEIVI